MPATCSCGQFLTTGAAFCPACTPVIVPKKVRKSQLADEVPDAKNALARALMAEAHADLDRKKKKKGQKPVRPFKVSVSPEMLFVGVSCLLFGGICFFLHFTSGWTSGFLMAGALVCTTIGGIALIRGLSASRDEVIN